MYTQIAVQYVMKAMHFSASSFYQSYFNNIWSTRIEEFKVMPVSLV